MVSCPLCNVLIIDENEDQCNKINACVVCCIKYKLWKELRDLGKDEERSS